MLLASKSASTISSVPKKYGAGEDLESAFLLSGKCSLSAKCPTRVDAQANEHRAYRRFISTLRNE
jgi:hypothetical protein